MALTRRHARPSLATGTGVAKSRHEQARAGVDPEERNESRFEQQRAATLAQGRSGHGGARRAFRKWRRTPDSLRLAEPFLATDEFQNKQL